MIELDLNIDKKIKKVKVDENFLFNAELIKRPNLIKTLIKKVKYTYVINDNFFEILNNYVDFNKDGESIYSGLIVRTNIDSYAVLYLEGSTIDEEYMLKIIDEYIYDINDYTPEEINVDKFEIDPKLFLKVGINLK